MRERKREFNEACNESYDSFDGFCPCNGRYCDFGRKIMCGDDVDYITILPERISKTRRPYGVWTRGTGNEKRNVYLRCPYCSWINTIPAKEVNSKGYVRLKEGVGWDPEIHCVTCRSCRTHFWPFLKGWRAKGRKR